MRLLDHVVPRVAPSDLGPERTFRDFYVLRSVPFLQAGFAVAAVLFSAFAIWDRGVDPTVYAETARLRFFVVSPLLVLAAAALFVPFLRRRVEWVLGVVLAVTVAGLNWIYWLQDGGYTYSITGNLMILVFLLVFVRARFAVVAALGVSVCAGYLVFGLRKVGADDPEFFLHNLVLLSTMAMGLIAVYVTEQSSRQVFDSGRELAAANQRIEDLLHELLPRSVAERLTRGERHIADPLDDAWVVFTDLVGFTKLANQLPPDQLVDLLNEMFDAFDEQAQEHGVERIKTIGDGYMALSHRPDASPQQRGERAVDTACGMIRHCRRVAASRGVALELRVGLHVGPVIAGVIGRTRHAYDLWGATVNLASRLESTAEPGTINISQRARELLGDRVVARDRGEIEAKGFGPVRMYTVTPDAA